MANLKNRRRFALPIIGAFGLCFASGCGVAASHHNMSGVKLFQQGQYPAAIQEFQHAISTQPTNADAYYNLASSIHRVGAQQKNRELLNQAEQLYNQCLDKDENHVDCRRALAVLLVETDRSDRAFNLMKNWVAENPRAENARVELARLYEEFGDNESATLNLQQALQLNSNNPRALAALGRLREQSGDITQALVNYQRSYRANPAQPAVAARIASLQGRAVGAPAIGNPNGTRTVSTGAPKSRY